MSWINTSNNNSDNSDIPLTAMKETESSRRESTRRDSVRDTPRFDEDHRAARLLNLTVENQYTWDCVFVFDVGSEDESVKVWDEEAQTHRKISQKEHFQNTTANIVNRCEAAGLKTDLFYSVQLDEIYCRVAASEKRLQQEADRIDYDLQLDERRCIEAGKLLELKLAEATEDPMHNEVSEQEWNNLYGKYDQLDPDHVYRQELYRRYNDNPCRPNSFFTSIDRIKLTVNIIEADHVLGGGEISMTKSISSKEHSMIAFFPLHEFNKKQTLMKRWYEVRSAFDSPVSEIRAYFGEAIGMYFGWLQSYNRSLLPIAILGLALFIWQLIAGKVDVEGLPVFAFIVSIWATLFMESWKRNEARYRVQWGMTDFNSKEQPRPEFKGDWKISPVDGSKIEVFPFAQKIKRLLLSQSVIWALIGIVIASVIGIMIFRKVLVDWNPTLGPTLTGVINAVQIQILNVVYGSVAYKLNDYENHRTDTEYQNALIAKSFLFKFVNSYNSLFYIAFVKKHDTAVDGCDNDNCLGELQVQLGTIFISSIVISNVMEVGIPYLTSLWTEYQNRAEDGAVKSPPEEEFELAEYESTFDDFDELVIQYGYVTLFVSAFPAAPLAALLNNIIETRVDATKLCQLSRRPEPRGAYDIGTWSDILNVVSTIAVMVNVGILCFETDLVHEWVDGDAASKAYVFIFFEHLILLIKFAVAYFVPDEPEEVSMHRERQSYLVNVLINGMEDEEDDDIEELVRKGQSAKTVEFNWERVSDTMIQTGREW